MLPLLALACLAESTLLDFSVGAWRKDPETRIEDAYKWLFHATQGGDHAIRSLDGPRAWMDREWDTLAKPNPGEPLWVPLRPDGKLGRLNLRPYRTAGGDRDKLLDAFVASAKSFRPDRDRFTKEWTELGKRLTSRPLGKLTRAEWERLDTEAKPRGYPAWDHSEAFERSRKPAYRVLTDQEFKRLRRAS